MRKKIIPNLSQIILSVPVRIKVLGIVIIPVLFLGLSLNYWVTTGLSDWLSYLIPDDRVLVAMEAGGRSVLLVSILAALAAILFSMLMMFMLTQPLLELTKVANQVAEGNLESRANIWSHDEIGEVASSFNDMVDHFVQSQEDLKVSNRQLSLMNKIAIASTQERELHDALYTMLMSVLDAVRLEIGMIYLYDEEREKFHLATWSGVPDEFKPAVLNCDPNDPCRCQRNVLSGEAQVEPKIIMCDRVNEIEGHHVSISLLAGERPLGVINLVTQDPDALSPEDKELLSISATQIGEFAAKAWLQLKLGEKEATRQKLMKALIKAQEDERSRLARELHDGAGQMLTSLMIRMKAFERASDDNEVSNQLNYLCENVSEVIEYIRQISYQNRPVVIEEFGLTQALKNLAEDMTAPDRITPKTDIKIEKIHLPKEMETTIYRITQESLTNVLRHAGATSVEIKLFARGGNLHLRVSDNGSGFDVEDFLLNGHERHMGLNTIKDRLEILGGKFELSSIPGSGTCLTAVLPLLEEIINVE